MFIPHALKAKMFTLLIEEDLGKLNELTAKNCQNSCSNSPKKFTFYCKIDVPNIRNNNYNLIFIQLSVVNTC